MKLTKLLTLTAGAVLLLATAAQAQESVGLIKAFLVKGDVTLMNNVTGESAPLNRGQEFSEGYTVVTGPDSSALLLFSNGASINVTPNTQFQVSDFEQAAYDPDLGTYLRLKKDPSVSKTDIQLAYGEIIGEVRKLNAGSSYTINTPIASAGIRGTVWVVSFDPQSGTFKSSNVNGIVTVTTPSGQEIPVPETKTVVIVQNLPPELQDLDPAVYQDAQSFMQAVQDAGFSIDIPDDAQIIIKPNTAIISSDSGKGPSPSIP